MGRNRDLRSIDDNAKIAPSLITEVRIDFLTIKLVLINIERKRIGKWAETTSFFLEVVPLKMRQLFIGDAWGG